MRYYQQNEKKCKTSSTLIESFIYCALSWNMFKGLYSFFSSQKIMLLSSGTKCNLIRRKQKTRPAVQPFNNMKLGQCNNAIPCWVKSKSMYGTDSFMQMTGVQSCASLCDMTESVQSSKNHFNKSPLMNFGAWNFSNNKWVNKGFL